MFSVNYEKAYDCVNWDFLKYVMKKMGFSTKWIKWMETMVFTSTMAIIVNSSCTDDFKFKCELRQGDPLSPLLFVIVMECLTKIMEKSKEMEVYEGFHVGEHSIDDIFHFADDTIIFGNGEVQNLWIFGACWDSKLNFAKVISRTSI